MTADALTPALVPTIRIGRKRTTHHPRILIEDNRVILRTRCGLNPLTDGFTETHGYVTCEPCEADWNNSKDSNR